MLQQYCKKHMLERRCHLNQLHAAYFLKNLGELLAVTAPWQVPDVKLRLFLVIDRGAIAFLGPIRFIVDRGIQGFDLFHGKLGAGRNHCKIVVADFGLSRLAPAPDFEGAAPGHVSTVVKGTPVLHSSTPPFLCSFADDESVCCDWVSHNLP